MVEGEDEEHWGDEDPESQRRDPKTDEAKARIEALVAGNPNRVMYHRQLAIWLEDTYFHWITGRALRELETDGKIRSLERTIAGSKVPIKVYYSPGLRYHTRLSKDLIALVARFSGHEFGRALGYQGELLTDSTAARAGMRYVARNVREFGGRAWTESKHNLDRVYEHDGLSYGAEIKNTLDYIPLDELKLKIRLAVHLGLVPLFIVRMMAVTHVQMVQKAGGIVLMTGKQYYPYGDTALAAEVKQELGLPVVCDQWHEDGAVVRLQKALGWAKNVNSKKIHSESKPSRRKH